MVDLGAWATERYASAADAEPASGADDPTDRER